LASNNHLPQHHEEISELSDSPDLSGFDITKIALVFDVDRHPYNKVLRIASERVLKRGENHQSLRPDMADRMRHETIVKRFQSEFVPPEGGLFDEEIRLSVVEDPLTNLKTAVNALWPILGKSEIPDHEHLQQALKDASEYRIEIVKKLDGVPSNPVRYYALSVELDLEQVVRSALLDMTGAQEEKEIRSEGTYFLKRLVDTGRIISKPHITIVHQKNVEAEATARVDQHMSDPLGMNTGIGPEQTMWKACLALDKLEAPTLFDFTATGLIWNDRVMTLVVGNLRPHHEPNAQGSDESEQSRSAYDAAAKVEEALCRTLTNVLHVTVGTADETIPPFEARGLVETWRRGEQQMTPGGNVRYLELQRLNTSGRVVGMN
jgi:tRNA ligase